MASTMADVARIAGVSKKTVSNYFNGYPYMRDETRERIEAAIAELNYKVNISARNLSSGRTGAIGLAVPELAHPYFAELAQAVVTAAQARGLHVLVEVTDGDREHELEVLHGMRGRTVDGLIFGPLALEDAEVEQATVDVPLVLIGDRLHQGRFDFVGVPNEEAAQTAVAHLIATGRRRIAAIGMEAASEPTAAGRRHAGHLRALLDAGLDADESLFVGPIDWTRTSGAAAVSHLLDAGARFDAVFAYNDALALGVLSELAHRGVHVPEDVAVIGFDNVEEASFSSPTLSTVDSGRDWIAETAVDRLAARLVESDEPVGVAMSDFSLVLRESS